MFNKLLSIFIIKNVKTGKPSYTITAFIVGVFIVNIKLLLSGVQINETFKFDTFNGVDYAAAMGALGGLYVGNKHFTSKDSKGVDNANN